MYGVMYLIWNMVNGKKYVGQTVKTVKERFKQHAKKEVSHRQRNSQIRQRKFPLRRHCNLCNKS